MKPPGGRGRGPGGWAGGPELRAAGGDRVAPTYGLRGRWPGPEIGISDNQTKLTYNLIAELEWRFLSNASALAGWRYMNIDLQNGSGRKTLNTDVSMSGPFLAVNLYF